MYLSNLLVIFLNFVFNSAKTDLSGDVMSLKPVLLFFLAKGANSALSALERDSTYSR
jgi:hypothetical protein